MVFLDESNALIELSQLIKDRACFYFMYHNDPYIVVSSSDSPVIYKETSLQVFNCVTHEVLWLDEKTEVVPVGQLKIVRTS